MLGPQHAPIITQGDLDILTSLWPAIVLSKPSEKLSVIRLKQNIVDTISKYFCLNTLELEISDMCLTAAQALWKHFPQPVLLQPDQNEIEEGAWNLKQLNQSNLKAYSDLLDELLRCILEESLHWRHRLMAMTFIRDLVHPNQVYSAKLVRYFLQLIESLELIDRTFGDESSLIFVDFIIFLFSKKYISWIRNNITSLNNIIESPSKKITKNLLLDHNTCESTTKKTTRTHACTHACTHL